ncbi:hypothetical protein [uncultured Nostoc sp.]|uniref:hypothetical protein n=1 Tax=uncultured Nostoc sp. TaxID=340711 RepID=UPI0035CB15B7
MEFAVCLCGTIIDEYGGQLEEGYTLISGGGIQRNMTFLASQAQVGIGFSMPVELLAIKIYKLTTTMNTYVPTVYSLFFRSCEYELMHTLGTA